RRRRRGLARAARRDRQRHRPRRGGRARDGGAPDAHPASGGDPGDDASGRPEAAGGRDGRDRERVAPVRRRHADADLSTVERRTRTVVRARHRAPPRDRSRGVADRRAGRARGRAGIGRAARQRRGPGAGARREGAGARRLVEKAIEDTDEGAGSDEAAGSKEQGAGWMSLEELKRARKGSTSPNLPQPPPTSTVPSLTAATEISLIGLRVAEAEPLLV